MSAPTPTPKLGLKFPGLPGTGQAGGVLSDLVDDILTLEHGSPVFSSSAPANPHDGEHWWDTINHVEYVWNSSAATWMLLDVGGTTGLAAHIASNPATHGDGSIRNNHLADDSVDAAKLKDDASVDANRAVTTNHIRDAAITTPKIAAGAVTDTVIGSRTSVDTTGSPSLTGGLLAQLSSLWTTLKAIKGTAGALDAPPTTLTGAKAHADNPAPHGGHSTPSSVQTQIDAHNVTVGAHRITTGTVFPEGVVSATAPWLYVKDTGEIYAKTGSGTTGWRQVNVGTILCQVRRTGDYNPADNTKTAIPWQALVQDTSGGAMWASGANAAKMFATESGVYRATFYALWDTSNNNDARCTLRRYNADGSGGTDIYDWHGTDITDDPVIGEGQNVPVLMTAGQYVQWEVTIDQGSTRGLNVSSPTANSVGTMGIHASLTK